MNKPTPRKQEIKFVRYRPKPAPRKVSKPRAKDRDPKED